MINRKRGLLFILLFFILVFYYFDLDTHLSLDSIHNNLHLLKTFYFRHPSAFILVYMLVFTLIVSLTIPGSIILTLLAGALFDFYLGVILITLSGTIGSSISFVLSRYLFRECVMYKFRKPFIRLNDRLEKRGAIYLLFLRLFPALPFGFLNILLGLTSVKWTTFFWVTIFGVLPGNLIYVYAGKKIMQIHQLSEVFTPLITFLLIIFGLVPFLLSRFLFKKTV